MADSNFLINMTIALAAAFMGATIAARLGQSTILGYIVGGIVIGPFTPGFVGDAVAVETLADIGIILLMFAIGVQLSMRELMRAGRVALLGGSAQVLLTIALGYLVGIALGWSPLQALFFGAVISNSSSTVLSKVLGERGEAGSVHGQVGLAWSTIQDLSTIILVVVLTALSTGGDGVLVDLLWATGMAVLFLVLLVPVGSRILPWFFARVAALQNREAFILTVATFALGTAYVSSLFGLSLALGAFVAGVVVSESDLSHQILGEVEPLRDIFAGLFFVSVGMLVDPMFVIRNLPLVLLTLALIVLAKGLMIARISLLFRYPARVAMLIGVTLAQSAEFSFLLARLGADLDVLTPEIFSLLLAGAAVSIVISPALHSAAGPFGRWLEQRTAASSPLSWLPVTDEAEPPLRGHMVLCGYGRVGGVIGDALTRRGFPFVVIEQDQYIVRRLREQGVHALLGNADNYALLDQVHLEHARVLVVATPDSLAARRIVDRARQINPRLNIVVRSHDQAESARLADLGVNETVVGELELALEMTRFTLRRFGVGSLETQAIVQGLRSTHANQIRDIQDESS
ncbi:cation:proton antiporter [soil metagenome]